MSLEDQLRMVKDYDVILERCYAQNMGGGKYKSNLPDNLALIREVGYEHVMVDTDGGQVENPHWELALAEYMQYLLDHGIPEEQVYHMTHTIPARLLGLEEGSPC
jgi:adenine deaminase